MQKESLDDFLQNILNTIKDVHGVRELGISCNEMHSSYGYEYHIDISHRVIVDAHILKESGSTSMLLDLIMSNWNIEKSCVVISLRKNIENLKEQHCIEIEKREETIKDLLRYKHFYQGHTGRLE